MLTITKRLEFDAGHRIPDHKSQCRSLHGHRYVLEITLRGEPIDNPGASDHGMLMDFADVKAIANAAIAEPWDHAFLVYAQDQPVRRFLESMPDHRTVVIDRIPTVENLARIAFDTLRPLYRNRFGHALDLYKVRLYETPTCWAEVDAGSTG